MRLNPDCIRDILLTVEEHTDRDRTMEYPSQSPEQYKELVNYSQDVVLYHIGQCSLSKLFTDVLWYEDNNCVIDDLSPKGHEYIAIIRDNTNWEKTKRIARDVGSLSLNTLIQIGTSVISDLLNKRL